MQSTEEKNLNKKDIKMKLPAKAKEASEQMAMKVSVKKKNMSAEPVASEMSATGKMKRTTVQMPLMRAERMGADKLEAGKTKKKMMPAGEFMKSMLTKEGEPSQKMKTGEKAKGSRKPAVTMMHPKMQNEKTEKMSFEQASNTHNEKGSFKMDKEAMMNNHRKNVDAMSDASKMAVEVVKSISAMQTQYMRQAFEDFSAMMKEMSQAPMSPDNWKEQSMRMKDSMSKAVDHASNVSNIMVKSNSDMYSKMQNHMSDSFESIKYAAMGRKK